MARCAPGADWASGGLARNLPEEGPGNPPGARAQTGTGFDSDLGSTSGRDEKRVALTRSTHPFWMVLTLVFGFSDVFVLDQALAGALHLGLGGSPV